MSDSPLAWVYLVLLLGVLVGWGFVMFALAMKDTGPDIESRKSHLTQTGHEED